MKGLLEESPVFLNRPGILLFSRRPPGKQTGGKCRWRWLGTELLEAGSVSFAMEEMEGNPGSFLLKRGGRNRLPHFRLFRIMGKGVVREGGDGVLR